MTEMASEARPSARSRSLLAALALLATVLATGCAPDPPEAVVGLVVDGCDPGIELGSGMIVAPNLVLTSAHVVAGADSIEVVSGTRRSAGTILAFDPEMDLAYLSIDDWPARTPPVDSDHVEAGDRAVAYVVREGEVVALPVTIERRVRLNTEDVYVEGETRRPGFELDANIRPGDSGGAVLVEGRVAGVLWATSRRDGDRAYAIDPVRAGDLIRTQLRTGVLGDDIDLARCD